MFSATEAVIAVDEARAFGLPVAVNLTLKYTRDRKSGATVYRTDWGHSCADLLDLLASGRYAANGDDLLPFVDVVGVNCGAEQRRAEHTGMPYAAEAIRQMRTAMTERGITGKRLMAYPNAGMPRIVAGATHYDHPPRSHGLTRAGGGGRRRLDRRRLLRHRPGPHPRHPRRADRVMNRGRPE